FFHTSSARWKLRDEELISCRRTRSFGGLSTTCRSDLPPFSAHGIIRRFGLGRFLTYPPPELWESGKRVLQRFPSLPFFGKRLFHSSLLPAPHIRSASDTPNCCAAVLRCTPSSTPRSCAWRRTDSGTSSRSNILLAAAHESSPRARSGSACPVESESVRCPVRYTTPENAGC